MLPSLIKSSSGKAEAFVIARDFHDQAQVGLDHLFAGLFVALLDSFRQRDLFLWGQQLNLADFAR